MSSDLSAFALSVSAFAACYGVLAAALLLTPRAGSNQMAPGLVSAGGPLLPAPGGPHARPATGLSPTTGVVECDRWLARYLECHGLAPGPARDAVVLQAEAKRALYTSMVTIHGADAVRTMCERERMEFEKGSSCKK